MTNPFLLSLILTFAPKNFINLIWSYFLFAIVCHIIIFIDESTQVLAGIQRLGTNYVAFFQKDWRLVNTIAEMSRSQRFINTWDCFSDFVRPCLCWQNISITKKV